MEVRSLATSDTSATDDTGRLKLSEGELRNGWTPETLAAYLEERETAAGFVSGRGVSQLRVAGLTVTEYERGRPPIRMDNALKHSPHQRWKR